MKSHEFATLLCSRLCHDLLSPVGALNNGIELLADEHDPEMRARCLDLLAESARASANKLKFFRLAFGAAGGFADVVDTREAKAAIEGLFGGDGRIKLGWMVDEPTMSKAALKVLLNIALIAGDALVRGGSLDVGAEKHDERPRHRRPRRGQPDRARSGAQAGADRRGRRGRRRPARRRGLARPLPGPGRRRQIQVADEEEGMLLIGAACRPEGRIAAPPGKRLVYHRLP